jgi:hypothetical protein
MSIGLAPLDTHLELELVADADHVELHRDEHLRRVDLARLAQPRRVDLRRGGPGRVPRASPQSTMKIRGTA